MDLMHVKVGDVVIARNINENRMPSLRGERRVVKVGRKYLFVENDRRGFDRATGRVNDAYGHAWVETVEAHEERERFTAASSRLRNAGIEFTHDCALPRAKRIEIANAVLAMLDEQKAGR